MSNIRNRSWMFTLFGFSADLPVDTDARIKWWTYQKEKAPSTNNEHIQGYVVFFNALAMNTVKALLMDAFKTESPPHLEIRRGSHEQAKAYCEKTESRVAGPWGGGREPHQGYRTDLHELAVQITSGKRVVELIDDNPEDIIKHYKGLKTLETLVLRKEATLKLRKNILVTAIIGPSGCGKTRWIYEHENMAEIYEPIITKDKVWFDGYEGQEVLVLDNLTKNMMPRQLFMKMLDIYPLQLEVKGSSTYARWIRVYITSVYDLEHWFFDWTPHGVPTDVDPELWRRIHIVQKWNEEDNKWNITRVHEPVAPHIRPPSPMVADEYVPSD